MKWLKKLFHVHKWEIILSAYMSFNYRKVIYQCEKCGQKKWEPWVNHESVYPFQTTEWISDKEAQDVVDNKAVIEYIIPSVAKIKKEICK